MEEAHHVQRNCHTSPVARAAIASPRIVICSVDVGKSPGEAACELRELLGNLVFT